MRERADVVRDYVVGELKKRGITMTDIARRLGMSVAAVQQVARCWTSTPKIQDEIIRTIGADPWAKFPPQPYQIPKDAT